MVPVWSRCLTLVPLLFAMGACQQRRTAPAASSKELQGTWLQSTEETRGDTLFYRPNTYQFPPSRGRTGFAIGQAGRFTQFDVAPTDGLTGHDGTWTVPYPTHLRIHLADGSSPDYSLEIIDLHKGVLKLRRQ